MFLSSSSQVNKASYFQGLQVTFFCPIRVYSSNGFALVSVGILLKLVNDRVTRHLLDSVSSTNPGSTIYVSSAFFEKSEFPDGLNERWVETATAMRTRQTDTKPPTTTSICETTGFESQKKIVSHFIGVSRASFNLARGVSIKPVAFGQWQSRNYFSFFSRPFLDILW